MDTRTKDAQLVRVAELYYEQGMNQGAIAKIMGSSPSTVSRLLAEALELGIVEITIHRPITKQPELARLLREQFDLQDVIVVEGGNDYEDSMKNVASAAAEWLATMLRNDDVLGISFGNTLYHTANAMNSMPFRGVEVVQLIGGLGQGDPAVDGPELTMRFARKLNAKYRYINAPCVVESVELRDQLMSQPQVRQTIERGLQSRIMMTGVGALADQMSSLVRAGYMTTDDVRNLSSHGAVGHLNAQMINIYGDECEDEFNRRVIGVPLDSMRHAEWSVGIAASALKAPPILGGVRGGFYNALIIDDGAAREVLSLAEAESDLQAS